MPAFVLMSPGGTVLVCCNSEPSMKLDSRYLASLVCALTSSDDAAATSARFELELGNLSVYGHARLPLVVGVAVTAVPSENDAKLFQLVERTTESFVSQHGGELRLLVEAERAKFHKSVLGSDVHSLADESFVNIDAETHDSFVPFEESLWRHGVLEEII